MKYYGTNITLALSESIKERLDVPEWVNQYRLVCKAKSLAEANRIAEANGLGRKAFRTDYTSETGNQFEVEVCDAHVLAVFPLTHKQAYVTIDEIRTRKEGAE